MTPKVPENSDQGAPQFFPERFKLVQTTIDARDLIRDPMGGRVAKTGYVLMNTSSSEGLKPMAEKEFGGLTKCGVIWGADPDVGEVAGRFVAPNTKGVTAVRENKDGTLGLRMSGLFKDHPTLRPETAKWVSLSIDPSGAFFILHLNLALPQPTRKRKAGAKSAGGTATKSDQAKA